MNMKSWKKKYITLDDGQRVEAIAPVIISASRSTDLPAFHAEWFMNRLRAGYTVWRNPFNQRQQYISFSQARVIVFWSKNPAPLLPYLREIEDMGYNYYFQFTINDYEDEGWEPRIPSLAERVTVCSKLFKLVGPERIIWRFDPLLLSDSVDENVLIQKIERVGNLVRGFTQKLVFSFADIETFRKVRTRMTKEGISYQEFDHDSMRSMAERIAELNVAWGLKLGTCSESIDLMDLGIEHNRCIDGSLMRRLFANDRKLQAFLSSGQSSPSLNMSGLHDTWQNKFKDKGQRKECGCIVSKDIGAYDTCGHFCSYCYANKSNKSVLRNLSNADPLGESII